MKPIVTRHRAYNCTKYAIHHTNTSLRIGGYGVCKDCRRILRGVESESNSQVSRWVSTLTVTEWP